MSADRKKKEIKVCVESWELPLAAVISPALYQPITQSWNCLALLSFPPPFNPSLQLH